MTRLEEITKILELYQSTKTPDFLYAQSKPSLFFIDERHGVMVAQMFDLLEDNSIKIYKSVMAEEYHIDDDSLAAYRYDAQNILFRVYTEQMKTQLYMNYVHPQPSA